MSEHRFILNATRSSKQGVHINIGKFDEAYEEIVTTLEVHPDDLKTMGVAEGDWVLVKTEAGSAEFRCKSARVPLGMLVVPYGPPTCRLMSGDTDGTGMPLSKGWEVTVTRIEKDPETG